MDWWKIHYPGYYDVGVKALSEEEQMDPTKYYYKGKYKHDLVYAGLNVHMLTAFLSCKKQKENGKLSSKVQLRKYKDAILWGSRVAGEPLPSLFYTEIDTFLSSFKKEHIRAKKNGNLDEQEADPISWNLYHLITEWAVSSDNIFVWVWTVMQWNLLGRAISIDPLGLRNFSMGLDFINCCYDDSKSDKDGERTHDKNVYANPLDPLTCMVTAMGVWFACARDTLSITEKLFLAPGKKEGSASHRYQKQLTQLLSQYKNILKLHIRPAHANSHGFRKRRSNTCNNRNNVPTTHSIRS
jgi:hypothetical protein